MMTEQERQAKFEQAVMDLHSVARLVESTVGKGLLSEDIRDCADRLHKLTKYDYITKS
jgi:hypothetical protein